MQELLYMNLGRINRKKYLLSYLAYWGVGFLAIIIAGFTTNSPDLGISIADFFGSIFIIFFFIQGIKRCHDIGKSGSTMLLAFVPLLNAGLAIWLLVTTGENIENEYGAVPK